MKNYLLIITALLLTSVFSTPASAILVGYVNNPSSNSADWFSAVVGSGGTINSNINFDSMALGGLNGNFYQGSDGVRLTTSGDFNGVVFGAGPGDGDNVTPTVNSGEGLHGSSNYLSGGDSLWGVTVSFDSLVSGFGLDIIDYFGISLISGSGEFESLTLEAFSGANGTGSSLGSFSGFNQNYQNNNTYFMGLASDTNDIRSIVFTDFDGGTHDNIGLDRFVFSVNSAATVPEPSTTLLLGSGLLCLFVCNYLRRKQTG